MPFITHVVCLVSCLPQIRRREAELLQRGAHVLFRVLLPRRRPYSRQDDDVVCEGTTHRTTPVLPVPSLISRCIRSLSLGYRSGIGEGAQRQF